MSEAAVQIDPDANEPRLDSEEVIADALSDDPPLHPSVRTAPAGDTDVCVDAIPATEPAVMKPDTLASLAHLVPEVHEAGHNCTAMGPMMRAIARANGAWVEVSTYRESHHIPAEDVQACARHAAADGYIEADYSTEKRMDRRGLIVRVRGTGKVWDAPAVVKDWSIAKWMRMKKAWTKAGEMLCGDDKDVLMAETLRKEITDAHAGREFPAWALRLLESLDTAYPT